jgi:hypothetical protein
MQGRMLFVVIACPAQPKRKCSRGLEMPMRDWMTLAQYIPPEKSVNLLSLYMCLYCIVLSVSTVAVVGVMQSLTAR